jgi:hypothetical protein
MGAVSEVIDPEALGQLHALLLDRYPDWSGLSRLLLFDLGKHLAHITSQSNGMETVVQDVIVRAYQEDWCHRLIIAVIKRNPRDEEIREWMARNLPAARNPVARPETVPGNVAALDTAFFDLDELRKAIELTLATVEGGVTGFGIQYPDLKFVNKVCEWLPYVIGETQRKDPLSLRPEFAPVTQNIKQILRYRRDLDDSNVACPVLAEGVPLEIVETLWSSVHGNLTGLKNSLVLIMTTYPGNALPDGVVMLPAPKFTEPDIAIWTRQIARSRNWPPATAKRWTSYIVSEAEDGTGLDVRAVYEAMDRTITELRTDPAGFRARLEQGR